jgi:predicted MFS family arabinose efflux permease
MSLALLIFTVILAHCAYGAAEHLAPRALSAGALPRRWRDDVADRGAADGAERGRWQVRRLQQRARADDAFVSVLITAVAPRPRARRPALLFSAAGISAGYALQICASTWWADDQRRDRRDNFGWLALGFATSNFIGPTVAGLAIDRYGHDDTFMIFAGFALASLVTLVVRRSGLTHKPHAAAGPPRSAWELMRDAKLRRVFIISGLLLSSWDLFVFIMPIYGTSIGLNATTIGLILAIFAAATFTVRLMLPILSRLVKEWTLITMTFAIALVAYIAFPMVRTVPLLSSIAFLLGLGLGATQPTIMALVYSTAPAGRAGEAVGVRTVVLNASHTVLPLVFGGLGTVLGSMLPVFWTMSVALAAGAWYSNRTRSDPD